MSVTVIGCGAVGSAVILQLAKMGVPDIRVYDDDRYSDAEDGRFRNPPTLVL